MKGTIDAITTSRLPMAETATDRFELNGVTCLAVVDYFSRYLQVMKLRSTTLLIVINAQKTFFTCHGIPEKLGSNNVPQFSSTEFTEFGTAYEFKHITSSPHYSQGNGQAERMIKMVKKILKTSQDQC